jgi:hypothetical protein
LKLDGDHPYLIFPYDRRAYRGYSVDKLKNNNMKKKEISSNANSISLC